MTLGITLNRNKMCRSQWLKNFTLISISTQYFIIRLNFYYNFWWRWYKKRSIKISSKVCSKISLQSSCANLFGWSKFYLDSIKIHRSGKSKRKRSHIYIDINLNKSNVNICSHRNTTTLHIDIKVKLHIT